MKLSLESEQRLITRAQRGDQRAINDLLAMHERYMRYQSSRYRIPGLDSEDNYSIAMEGMVIAIGKYDASHGTRLCTTAYFYVRRELEHALRCVIGSSDRAIAMRRKVTDFVSFSQIDGESWMDILSELPAQTQFSMISAAGITDEEWEVVKSELSERERSILDMFVGGDNHTEIAAALGISNNSVGVYINKKLPKKLSARILDIGRPRATKTPLHAGQTK